MHYPPTRGDAKAQFERWDFSAATITNANSFRGMYFGKLTATAVELYSSQAARTTGTSPVATGNHGQTLSTSNTAFLICTLSAANASGLGSNSITVFVCAKEASATWEVWPTFATDTQLARRRINVGMHPKQAGASTWLEQHFLACEDLVRMLRQKIPPIPGMSWSRLANADARTPWRQNSVGDLELVGLQNLDDYRKVAEHLALAEIFRQTNRLVPDGDTQLRIIEEEDALAKEAFAEVIPLDDVDQNLTADRERKRFRVSRG